MTVTTVQYGEIITPAIQIKPWGHEVVFATGENDYVGKIITVTAGQALSLQYHDRKDETIRVLSGEATLEHGPSAELLRTRVMRPGHTVHLAPSVVHRITAITDVVLVEVSTAGPGWRDDVVRLADLYGRSGTSAP
jgi:mannose-6-phosphate isomerase